MKPFRVLLRLETGILEKFDGSRSNFGGMVFVACRSACCKMGKVGKRESRDLSLVESVEERIPGVIAGEALWVDGGQEDRIAASIDVEELRVWAEQSKDLGKFKRYQSQGQLIDLLLEGYSHGEMAKKLKF